MSDERDRLARYQAELLELLQRAESLPEAEESIRRLAAEAGLPDMNELDPRMVLTAMQLTKRWAR